MRIRDNRRWGILAAWLVLGSVAGCGGGAQQTTPVAVPESTAPPLPPAADEPPLEGQQFAISDEPTSGKTASERPKMNAAAASAYASGMTAFRRQDLARAKAGFTQATQADPRAYQAYYSLGVVKERQADTNGALAAYERAAAIVPDYEPAIVAYAVLLAESKRADDAVRYLNGRLAAMPNSAAVLAAMAEVKSIQGDSGAAQRFAQEALKKRPDYKPAMVTIARDHYRSRRLDLALYALQGILDGYGPENPPRDKDNAEARLIRGLIYKEQNQRGPAMTELKRAVELRPDLVEARVQLGAYLLEAGNAGEAARHLEAALRHRPDHVLAHLNLGDAYRLLGRPAEARRELEWVARKDPSLHQVHYNLGLLFLFSENVPGLTPMQAVDRAIAEFEQYRKLRGRRAGADDTEELITRAKTKKGLLEAKEEEASAAARPASAAPSGAKSAPAGGTP